MNTHEGKDIEVLLSPQEWRRLKKAKKSITFFDGKAGLAIKVKLEERRNDTRTAKRRDR